MKHLLKEEVWQCAGTITNANNHCKLKAKKKRDLVSHIQQEHLAEKVNVGSHIFKKQSHRSLSGISWLQVSWTGLLGCSILSQLPRPSPPLCAWQSWAARALETRKCWCKKLSSSVSSVGAREEVSSKVGCSQKEKSDAIFSTANHCKSKNPAGLVLHHLQDYIQCSDVSEDSHEREAQDVEWEDQPSPL